jgi:hypothetical protein
VGKSSLINRLRAGSALAEALAEAGEFDEAEEDASDGDFSESPRVGRLIPTTTRPPTRRRFPTVRGSARLRTCTSRTWTSAAAAAALAAL